MDERIFRTLEFIKVLERLKQHTSTSLGREKIEKLRPTSNLEEATRLQNLTFEGYTVLRLKGSVPFGGIRDIRRFISRAKLGSMLAAAELLDVAGTIYGGWRLRRFLEGMGEEQELRLLQELVSTIERVQNVEDEITSCIDENAVVVDHASAALAQIRSQLRTAEARIKERLEQILRSSQYQKMLQENLVSVRGDRYVIPVKQEYRHVFGGMIHDQSASGATLFIEPEVVVQANNQLRELRMKEEREIERILMQLSAIVAEHSDILMDNVETLAELDFVFAKASYAHQMKAVQPKLNNRGYIRLKKARHPLIAPEQVVPIDVELGDRYTSLIITGPNTGGKTVTLKTIGLHALMAASGLHIPAEEDSQMAVFSHVFADIGDEQSIEQNLSTFSGHMKNINDILRHMDEKSLILFDELGAGTDPTEGAALAISILDFIYRKGATVVATTHYSELKAYAYNSEKVLNASVEFDVETLRPTYRLLIGIPGRSNAFAIASRLGLPNEIISEAGKLVSAEDKKVETMIASLEENTLAAEQERNEAIRLRKEMERQREEFEQERLQFIQERNRLLEKTEEDAAKAVAKAKKEAEEIISELRKMAQEEQYGIKEHRLIEAKKRLEEATPSFEKEKERRKVKADTKPKVGDEVKVLSLGQKGEIISELGNDEYQVQIGILKMNIKAVDLQVIKAAKKKEQVAFTRVKIARDTVRTELDLRGFTVEEALSAIDKYLDDAVISNLHQVSLIHGKGTGALRIGVHNFLKKHRSVKSFRIGGQGEGGLGATIVELK